MTPPQMLYLANANLLDALRVHCLCRCRYADIYTSRVSNFLRYTVRSTFERCVKHS